MKTSLASRRGAGALLAAAALAGTTLIAAPALAEPRPAGAGTDRAAVAPVRATAPAAQPFTADPNAAGYDSFIVTYKETASNANARGRAKAWGLAAKRAGVSVKELRETALGSRVISTGEKLTPAESARFMADLKASGAVADVEPNAIMTAAGLNPVDADYGRQWGFHGVNGMRVPGAWDRTTGAGTVVAVIDTGITRHPDLDANVVPGYDFISNTLASRDGDGRDPDPTDRGDWYAAGECGGAPYPASSSWHGTHVAGTVAAVADTRGVVGVAPNAKIQPVRVLGKCGGSLADIADAIVWAAGGSVAGVPDNRTPADVINMSLGGDGMCGTTYQNAINVAVSRGVPVVVAAGNENQPAGNVRPANCRNTITVAASDSSGRRSSFSNYGSAVDVTAPGSGILSTVNTGRTTPYGPGYASYNGTSMATPHVAGLTALMLAASPGLTPAQVEATLKSTSRPMPVVCAEGCGAGLVDATKAMAALGGAIAPAPTPAPTPAPVPTPTSLLANGGFESGTAGWRGTPSDFVITDRSGARSGSRYGVLNGYGRSNTGVIEQRITVPASGAVLRYAVQVGTDERTTTAAYDTLSVQIVDGVMGTYTLARHSNLDAGGYTTRTVDLSRFAGKTVTLRFRGVEDSSYATVFRIDDVAVTAR
ncbi:S8 family peptidase [Micrococcus sp.]|uniref:S8 family peptidase n=1 Tax=Micrococcus sp. TaxID=1271 RepID=UPI002A91927D|nr:S8 family serine peptidase [Micrococcus sp.]MDY6055771.1 S8 family serine peptidase [Micrococcus sp.]